RQHSLPLGSADAPGRGRGGDAQRRPAPALHQRHVAGEPASHRPRQAGHPDRDLRRRHRPARLLVRNLTLASWWRAFEKRGRLRMKKSSVVVASIAVLGLALLFARSQTIVAQDRNATGSIGGTVTADRSEVRALRVKATDTVHKISYTVYT